jgi:predicted regulator of Ras-like GTPase activity (Roadblock/LC7/MglB family)
MADKSFGDFFISDVDDELLDEDDDLIAANVVVPAAVPAAPAPAPKAEPKVQPAPAPAEEPVAAPEPAPAPQTAAPAVARPSASTRQATREERLAGSLNELMDNNQEIQAAALVSLDGFTMASALPDGMQEDRVGAMSAAILGLGERAAAELGRGALSQVFIEGEGGYVVLISAGERAVLTALADIEAKLGLVLYDMKATALQIGEILG